MRGKEVSCMRRLDHLKTICMSGFRCYRVQVELLCGILEKSAAIDHVILEPKVTVDYLLGEVNGCIPEREIREWAQRAGKRFGKVITVVEADTP
ncbi:hypothetical protein ACP70R_002895 [Stipagrostis hirtigluma subsp. patula]